MTSLNTQRQSIIPEHYQTWLLDNNSLSKKLRQFTNNTIEHRLLSAHWAHPYVDECLALNLKPTDTAWVREIVWDQLKKPWVCARVIIPKSAIENNAALQEIISLEEVSLGDLLYQDAQLKREVFGIEALTFNHPYTLWVNELIGQEITTESLWIRRSIFYYHGQAILVIEVFLAEFFSAVKQKSLHE